MTRPRQDSEEETNSPKRKNSVLEEQPSAASLSMPRETASMEEQEESGDYQHRDLGQVQTSQVFRGLDIRRIRSE